MIQSNLQQTHRSRLASTFYGPNLDLVSKPAPQTELHASRNSRSVANPAVNRRRPRVTPEA
jgi:hypothetical protein